MVKMLNHLNRNVNEDTSCSAYQMTSLVDKHLTHSRQVQIILGLGLREM